MAVVTVVGRPNVGKSSLFNRIVGRRAAIVDDLPGVTRDRLYGETEWNGRRFYVVDTGGIVFEEDLPFAPGIFAQVRQAIEESDVILFVIDGRNGPNAVDGEIASLLRKSRVPILVVCNKIDDPVHEKEMYEAYGLGFEQVFPVSAMHGRNVEDLLDVVVSLLPEPANDEEEVEEPEISVALIGRPNVGKSSILNALLGEERSLVSSIRATTRDAIDSLVDIGGVLYRFIDTAGLRRKSRVDSDVEYYSNLRSFEAIDRCHVAVLVMEGGETATDQDKRLAGRVLDRGKGLVLVVNKWDLAPKREDLGDEMRKFLKSEFIFVAHAPTVFVSAKTGRNLHKIPEHVAVVHANRRRRISTSELNRLLRDLMAFERLPSDGSGRFLKVYYCAQVRTAPPTFAFFVNDPEIVTQQFHRHVEKQLRRLACFDGVPLRIHWRKSERKE